MFKKNTSLTRRDDLARISIQDALEEEDENDIIQFNLNFEIIKIHIHQLCKYSKLIQEEIQKGTSINMLIPSLEQDFKKYQIKDENIKIFFRLIKEEEIDITSDQYIDLCKLSEIFKVNSLKKVLKIYYQKFSKNLNLVINLMLIEKPIEIGDLFPFDYITNDFEQCLINNVDECLNNCLFGQLPVSTIYRIIEKSDASTITNDFLYDFIIKSIEERYCLFNFLDIKKLSPEKFNDLYQKYQQFRNSKYLFDYIKNDLLYIKELRDAKQTLENEVEQLKQMKLELENEKDKTNQSKIKFENEVNQLKQINIEIENENSQIKEKNTQMQNHIFQIEKNTQMQNHIFQIENKNQQLENKINDLENKLNQIKEKDKINDEKLDKFNSLEKMIGDFVMQFQNIKDIKESGIFLIIYKTFLFYACESGNVEFVKYIISLDKVDLNSKDVFYYFHNIIMIRNL